METIWELVQVVPLMLFAGVGGWALDRARNSYSYGSYGRQEAGLTGLGALTVLGLLAGAFWGMMALHGWTHPANAQLDAFDPNLVMSIDAAPWWAGALEGICYGAVLLCAFLLGGYGALVSREFRF